MLALTVLLAPLGCGGDAAMRTAGDPREGEGPGLRVGFVSPPGEESAWTRRGVALGAEEAAQTGSLVDASIELITVEAVEPRAVAQAVQWLRGEGVIAIIGGFDELSCQTLAELADHDDFLFLNVGCRNDRLRRAGFANTFHVEASDSMYTAEPRTPGQPGPPVLWHARLTRYGARQLNDRFERRFGTPPGPAVWAGWMAVKVLWESALRTGGTDAAMLSAYLRGDDAKFDGHKGEPLVFDPVTHQLRQRLFAPASPAARSALSPQERPVAWAGREPVDRARVLPDSVAAGGLAFVSNEGSGSISIIDTRHRRKVADIPMGARPRGIRAGPTGRRVYVALSDAAPTAETDRDGIAVLDLHRLEVVERHRAGSDPEQFAVSPDGQTLYASNEDAGTASITNLETGKVLATLIVGVEPEGVAVSPDGRWVYVTAETSNTVSVIDTRLREVVASFMVGARPRAATFSPDGSRAYVTNEISGTVSVVDTRDHRVVASIRLESSAKPVGVVVSPDGTRLYIANGHAHTLAVIDAATHQMIAKIPVGRRPWGVGLSLDGRYAYTANGGSDDVSVVDLRAMEVVATIPVGQRPWGITILR